MMLNVPREWLHLSSSRCVVIRNSMYNKCVACVLQ